MNHYIIRDVNWMACIFKGKIFSQMVMFKLYLKGDQVVGRETCILKISENRWGVYIV